MVDLPAVAVLDGLPLSPRERLRAFADMWLVDHGFIRDVYWNLHKISDELWRSAQPGPRHLRWAARNGIKTVLNLRGRRDTCGSYILERETCRALGLKLVDFPIRSRSALDRETVKAAAEIFDGLEYPVLMHCKSGADRAGMMSTLYLHVRKGVPLEQAIGQLSLRYGHIRQAKTGVIDYFFQRYLAESDGGRLSFVDWIERHYDPKELNASFHENWLAGILVNKILRRE